MVHSALGLWKETLNCVLQDFLEVEISKNAVETSLNKENLLSSYSLLIVPHQPQNVISDYLL